MISAYVPFLEHPDIDSTKTLIVNFNRFGNSSLDFFVYTFTKTTDWVLFHEIREFEIAKCPWVLIYV